MKSSSIDHAIQYFKKENLESPCNRAVEVILKELKQWNRYTEDNEDSIKHHKDYYNPLMCLNTREAVRLAGIRGHSLKTPYVNIRTSFEVVCSKGHNTKVKIGRYRKEDFSCSECKRQSKKIERFKKLNNQYKSNNYEILNKESTSELNEIVKLRCKKCIGGNEIQTTISDFIKNHGTVCTKCVEEKERKQKEKQKEKQKYKKIYYTYSSIVNSRQSTREAIFYTFDFILKGVKYKEYGISVNWACRRYQYEKEGIKLTNIEAIHTNLLEAYILEQNLKNDRMLEEAKPKENLKFSGWTECFESEELKDLINIF